MATRLVPAGSRCGVLEEYRETPIADLLAFHNPEPVVSGALPLIPRKIASGAESRQLDLDPLCGGTCLAAIASPLYPGSNGAICCMFWIAQPFQTQDRSSYTA